MRGGNITSKGLVIGAKGSRIQQKVTEASRRVKNPQEGMITDGIINHTARDNNPKR